MRILGILLLLLTCSWIPTAGALDLYSGEVTVRDQSAAERLSSVPAALIQVLQKHSGQRELPIHPVLDQALENAGHMLVSFRYLRHERRMPDGQVKSELRLVADFIPSRIDEIISSLSLPRWRHDRQPITVWIVVDDGLGRRLMPLEYQYAWEALVDVAALRGLPVAWPDINPERDGLIDLQLLWGGFTDALPGNGRRGGGDVIVAARREGPVWNVRWNFGEGDETSGWRVRDRDLGFALVDGVHRLADLVASRDSIAPDAQGDWQTQLIVAGLRSAEDYARCLSYLEGLGVVDAVGITTVHGDEVVFSLDLNALPRYLISEIDRDRILAPGMTEDRYTLVH